MRRSAATGRARRARTRVRTRSRVGLALAGGGPLGGIYEVGALLALTDSLDGIDLSDLDVYVGVSSGGFVAAALANGISPAQMYRLFIDDGADAALTPELFLRPALSEFKLRAARRANSENAGRRNISGVSAASAPSLMNRRYICAGEMPFASAAATKLPDDTPT